MRRPAAALAVCVLLGVPAAAAADCPRTTLGEVEHEAMCLECGVPLDVAENSLQARQERAFISRQIAACRSKDQIKSALAAQYGDRVLSTPKAKGFGLAAYLVPIGAVLIGAVLIGFAVARWRARRASAGTPGSAAAAPALDAGDSARLEADLGRYEV
jgi:cytochrome c-type biogenesis protein CcmH